jgi:Uma2 family endonuclease
MTLQTKSLIPEEVVYPDSDGQPMADNTLQFEWITDVKGNLEELFMDRADVFVAGDLLWYPVRGSNTTRVAPDVLVAFGRPRGYRGSYKQWEEDGIPPQVVFEIHSPCNTRREMARKLGFYEEHGVEEYYYLDPEAGKGSGWRRQGSRLVEIRELDGFVSPLLGIRFEARQGDLILKQPNGERFHTWTGLAQEAASERQRAEAERQRAEAERQRAEAERQRAERLAAKLRALGIEPDSPEG